MEIFNKEKNKLAMAFIAGLLTFSVANAANVSSKMNDDYKYALKTEKEQSALHKLKRLLETKNTHITEMKILSEGKFTDGGLWIKAWKSGDKRVSFYGKPLTDFQKRHNTKPQYTQKDYKIIDFNSPGETELLVQYDMNSNEYKILNDFDFKNNKKGAMREGIKIKAGAINFLAENFQKLAIDNPELLQGIKYLQSLNKKQGDDAKILINTKYVNKNGKEFFYDRLGKLHIEEEYKRGDTDSYKTINFIEEITENQLKNKTYRYYPKNDGLEKYISIKIGSKVVEKKLGFIPKRDLEKEQIINQNIIQTPTL